MIFLAGHGDDGRAASVPAARENTADSMIFVQLSFAKEGKREEFERTVLTVSLA